MTTSPRQITGPEPTERPPSFFEWFPWEKILIWVLFLGAVYLLRHFFFVIFMTFIVAYNMRAVVVRMSTILSPGKERVWLERILALVCFAALLGACYGVGLYFVPHLTEQTQKLGAKVGQLVENPQEKLDEVLADSLGRVLVRKQLGGPGDEAYDEAFETFQQKGLHPVKYAAFKRQVSEIDATFSDWLIEKKMAEVLESIDSDDAREQQLFEWVFTQRRQWAQEEARSYYEKEDRRTNREFGEPDDPPFEELPEAIKEARARKIVQTRIFADEKERAHYEERWKQSLVAPLIDKLRTEEPDRYGELAREHHDHVRQQEPGKFTYDFDRYLELRPTLDEEEPEVAFARALDGIEIDESITEEVRLERERDEFEREQRAELVAEFKQGEMAQKIGKKAEESIAAGLGHFTTFATKTAKDLFMLPVWLGLSLLLSLFVTFDFHKLRGGVRRLGESRVAGFYEEIAPGLYAFGRLIGRAFQAQAVIAFFNTVLTFLAIHFLGIQNAAFLCSIVFVCSFIPVVGVILSSIPIAAMAIIQDSPNAGILLGLSAIGAILLIHFIETSILNPKILGDMLHLHPVLVLAILAIGEHFFGVWGLLLGVPVIVYVIRFVILDEGIPGLIEPARRRRKPPPGAATAAPATVIYASQPTALPGHAEDDSQASAESNDGASPAADDSEKDEETDVEVVVHGVDPDESS